MTTDYCYRCKRDQPVRVVTLPGCTEFRCAVCDWLVDQDFDDDDDYDSGHCPTCGGDGTAEYRDHPEAWGEDTPALVNHMITCPNCGGTGMLKDCKYG